MQSIILIGKPNVGKSSLFNRIARQRIAITSEISGTTRDTNKIKVSINGKEALLIDSGGLDESNELFKNVKQNSLNAAKNADIILYLVDGKNLPDEEDRKFFYTLKKLQKPMALIINKVDNKKDEERAYEFVNFGVKELFNLSVTHNVGLDELYAWLENFLHTSVLKNNEEEQSLEEFLENFDEEKEIKFKEIDENHIKIGIVGRVNVGKSSLLNALVKKQRSVVSQIDGTTIDPVNEKISLPCKQNKIKTFEFIDTAGIRRRGKIDGIEKYALLRTQKILENADIALLILDASEGINELDERIAGLASKHELGVIIVLNKWDKISADEKAFDKICLEIKDRFKFLSYAPIISISALGGKRVHKIYDLILSVYENYTQKLQTAKLNEILTKAQIKHPPAREHGRVVKIYYGVQFSFAPPRIALITNKPRALHFSYMRYLQNQIRQNFNLTGTPLVLIPKHKNKDESG